MAIQFEEQDKTSGARASELPPCCGTGCAVCVLDYLDDCQRARESESNLTAMLDAFEQAQASLDSGNRTAEDGESL